MQLASYKKLYQIILNSSQSTQSLQKALHSILRLAINHPYHFNFLIHNINWFNQPYINHFHILQQILRIFKGRNKQSQKVVYNLLTDAMSTSSHYIKICQCFLNLIANGFDLKLVKQSINENYPHKSAELQSQLNYLNSLLLIYKNCQLLHSDILQTILLQLTLFDTELPEVDKTKNYLYPKIDKISSNNIQLYNNIQYIKFDTIITNLLDFIIQYQNIQQIFHQLLNIFIHKLILIKDVKYIQFIIYYFAELNITKSKIFITLLLTQLIQKISNKCNRNLYQSLNHYLYSYISRSCIITPFIINKTIQKLINLINLQLNKIPINTHHPPTHKQQSQLNLHSILQQNYNILLLLQSAICIWIYRPQCQQTTKNEFEKLLKRASQLIYYQFFIHSQVLTSIKFIKIQQGILLKEETLNIQHKFNPPYLAKLQKYVDPIIRHCLQQQVIQQRQLSKVKQQSKQKELCVGLPTKRVKTEKGTSEDTNSSLF